ncbi:MAG: hypothetical protein ACFB50_08700 [Rubrobacteraceae bacterium]
MDGRSNERGGRDVLPIIASAVVGIFLCVLFWLATGSLALGLLVGFFFGGATSIRNIGPGNTENRWWPRL